MSGKFSYQQIKQIINCTAKKYDNVDIHKYEYIRVGYYVPSNANWAYEVFIIQDGKYLIQVVATFGHIIAKGDF